MGLDRYRQRFFEAPATPTAGSASVLLRVPDINDPQVAWRLKQSQADVTIAIGASILRSALLQAAEPTIVNIHGGYLPYY